MKNKDKRSGFTPQESLVSILPSTAVGIIIVFTTVSSALVNFSPQDSFHKVILIICGVFGAVSLAFYYFIHTVALDNSSFVWVNTTFAGFTLCAMDYFLPVEISHLIYILAFISALPASLLSSRGPSYLLIFSVTAFHFILNMKPTTSSQDWITHIGFTVTAFIGIETVHQLKKMAAGHINRLEIINELSKQIVSTLDTAQVFALLSSALQGALEADAYYIGTVHGDQLHLEFLYDDGEYFQDVKVNKKGTLSNWVIAHQRGLFLPDLRKRIELEDVEIITVGKDKPTHSWMGVPMRGTHVDGFMAISAYYPNAFHRRDMELLYTIAQRAALALDNSYHHALVEKQAQLDSLTGVYNHGYFIHTLREQAQTCQVQNQQLSLIMLDVDHFKQYNDTFGHLIGDEVLTGLCEIIRSHIKSTDAVGRWGGEEFCIALPNTNEEQAIQVAQRIRETMAALKVKNAEQMTIPLPTVSQGIAIFPAETDDVTKLIDLADRRLYIAKKRGRDQIESASVFVVEQA